VTVESGILLYFGRISTITEPLFDKLQAYLSGLLADRRVLAVLGAAACALLVTTVAVGWFTQPDRYSRGYSPEQPVPYSHKLHAGTLGIPCLYCHTGARESRHAGVPSVRKCMNCHKVTKKDSPAVVELARRFESGERLGWKRVHDMPDHVFFDHRPHVSAGIDCRSCHGKVEEMVEMEQHMSVRMGDCLGCHRRPEKTLPPGSKVSAGPEHCYACHR